jgi:spectinomycin phosphotransferase
VTEKLRRWISEDFGLEVGDLIQVHEGADTAAEVWQGRATDGRYAVKWSGGGTDAGPLVTAYLGAGISGIPQPRTTRAGGLWSHREGKRLSLTPWIEGARAAEAGLTNQEWSLYGVLLARVHATEVPANLQAVLPRLNPINGRMPALTQTIQLRLTTEPPADAIEEELAAVWQANQETIAGLVELNSKLEPPQGELVICHADPHLGNVLVEQPGDGGSSPAGIHLIDWDDVVLAPREQDLMFMLGGMGSLGPTTADQLAAFFDGYGDITLDETNLTYYRCARALEDVALWAEQAIHGPDREECLAILRGVLAPDGLAVRALA